MTVRATERYGRNDLPAADNAGCTRTGLLLIEDFSMLCVSCLVNAFRSANRLAGFEAFSWDYITLDDQPVRASDGLEAPSTCPLSANRRFDYFFVCAGLECDPPLRPRLHSALRRFSRNSTVFGGLSTGAFMLARAGLLENREFTLHWENQPAFREEFPELEPSSRLYVMDGNLWTSSGGFSNMDLALCVIEKKLGEAMANAVGNQYQIDRIRDTTSTQRPDDLEDFEALPVGMQTVIRTMRANIETPLPISVLASRAGMTVRSLERQFRRYLGVSPGSFYRRMRLSRVRNLLWHSNSPICEIAMMTGFSSPSYLSRSYHLQFGRTPSGERRNMRWQGGS